MRWPFSGTRAGFWRGNEAVTDVPVTNLPTALADVNEMHAGLELFWSKADGWAPAAAMKVLSQSRLDWLTSLSGALRHWSDVETLSQGELILAWANLGALVEGTLKIFLCVYLDDYERDKELCERLGLVHKKGGKKGLPKVPDELMLESLKQFCMRRNLINETTECLIELVQRRRNAIHAFSNRELGAGDDLAAALLSYREFLADITTRLPYPDDYNAPWLRKAYAIDRTRFRCSRPR